MNLRSRKAVFLLAVLFCMLPVGCSVDKTIKTEPFHEEKIANLDEIWKEYETVSYETKDVVKKEDVVYILLEAWGEDEQEQVIYRVEDNEVMRVGNWETEENTITAAMDVDGMGNFCILEEIRDREVVHSNIKIVKSGDNVLQNVLLDSYLGENDTVKLLQWSDNRKLYLFLESGNILILSEDLQLEGEILEHEGEYFVDAVRMQDGTVAFISATYHGDKETLVLYEIENEETHELLELPEGEYGTNILLNGSNAYDYCIKGEQELFGGKKEGDELTPILKFQDTDMEASSILFLCSITDDRFFAIHKAEKEDLIYLVKGQKQGEENKEILKLASLEEDSQIEKEVAEFNKNSDSYRIETINYGDCEQPLQKFSMDLSSGEEFDLVEFPSEETDKLAAKGIFADLYPFMDADTTLNRDDFYENMLTAFEYDGKLYHSVSFVHLYGWVTKQEKLGDMGQWDVDTIRTYMEEHPGISIFTDTSGEEILKQMILASTEKWMDWEHKSCNFDSEDFQSILKLAKVYGESRSQITDADRIPALLEKRLLFVETPISIEYFCAYYKALGGDMTVVASPYEEQLGANLYSTVPQIGILANSDCQEGAWQFVRRFFTSEYQDVSDDAGFQSTGYVGFPIRKDCVEDLFRRFTATEDYEKDGKWYTAMKPNGYSIGWDEFDIDIGPMEESEEKMLRELLSHAQQKQELDTFIWNIVQEESQHYFNGEKSAEETAKIIQNRVTTYMNEV